LAAISGALSCLLAPVMIIAVVLMMTAWFIAAKEALDLEWLQTIVTVFLGRVALVVVGIALLPVWAAIGAIAALVTDCTIVVEKVAE
jgi:hypothetical protein